jgi:hypothetical protein
MGIFFFSVEVNLKAENWLKTSNEQKMYENLHYDCLRCFVDVLVSVSQFFAI